MQNDFADPEGSLYVPRGEEVVAVVNQERSTWSRTMAPGHSRSWFRPEWR